MNANLTINSLSFNQQYSDKDAGSSRLEISRGVNLPEILTIRHRQIVDQKSKLPARQTVVKLERHEDSGAGDVLAGLEIHTVITVPQHTAVSTADVQAVVDRMITVLAGTTVTGGLGLGTAILVNAEQ